MGTQKNKLEIKERKILFNGIEVKDGTLVEFEYDKKRRKYNGYFYIADYSNRFFGCDFMLSHCKRENWKFWSWKDSGYSKGFQISKVYNFKIEEGISHPNAKAMSTRNVEVI